MSRFNITKENNNEFFTLLKEFRARICIDFSTSQADIAKIFSTLFIMCMAHADQTRKDGSIYITHPLQVANLVNFLSQTPDPEAIISALLHDVVEDQSERFLKSTEHNYIVDQDHKNVALSIIRARFGAKVAQNVAALSNPDSQAILQSQGMDPNHPQYQEKMIEIYADHVKQAIQDPQVCVVKYADFVCNAGSLANLPDSDRKYQIAFKYLRVIPIFLDRITDFSLPLNTNAQLDMCDQLQSIRHTLVSYLAGANPISHNM